jgi:hypothetical protein
MRGIVGNRRSAVDSSVVFTLAFYADVTHERRFADDSSYLPGKRSVNWDGTTWTPDL